MKLKYGEEKTEGTCYGIGDSEGFCLSSFIAVTCENNTSQLSYINPNNDLGLSVVIT